MDLEKRKNPIVSDSFFMRICYALEKKPKTLAAELGIPYKDIKPLIKGHRFEMSDSSSDYIWVALNHYVGHRMAMLMTVKQELNRKTQKERNKKAARLQRLKDYDAEW